MKKERFIYLDILKCIAIILVCCYHFSWCSNLFYNNNLSSQIIINRFIFSICSICIPIFFMVNGALLLNKKFDIKKHFNSITKMLIQYYIWRLITIIVLALINTNINLTDIGFFSFLKCWILFGSIDGIDLASLWFIPTLLSIHIIFPFIKSFFENKDKNYQKYLIIFLVFIFITTFLPNDLIILKNLSARFANADLSGIKYLSPFKEMIAAMTFFFILGGIFQKNKDKININNFVLILTFLFGLSLLTIEWYVKSKTLGVNWDNVFSGYTMTSTLIMSISIFLIFSKIPNDNIYKHKILYSLIHLIGDNTLTIYYCHWIFGYTILPIISPFFANYFSISLNIIKSFLIVLLFSIIGKYLKKIPVVRNLFK